MCGNDDRSDGIGRWWSGISSSSSGKNRSGCVLIWKFKIRACDALNGKLYFLRYILGCVCDACVYMDGRSLGVRTYMYS